MNYNTDLLKGCTDCLTDELPVLRKMTGLTQENLGQIIGVSRQTIAGIENKKRQMKWPTFLALMFIFSLDGESAAYLKTLDIPYDDLKQWIRNIREVK